MFRSRNSNEKDDEIFDDLRQRARGGVSLAPRVDQWKYSMFQKYPITTCDDCHFRPNGPIDTKFGEEVQEGLN